MVRRREAALDALKVPLLSQSSAGNSEGNNLWPALSAGPDAADGLPRRALSEGGHKLDAAPMDGAPSTQPGNGPKTGVKRNFNEAAHKLGYWPVTMQPRKHDKEPSEAIRAASDDERDVVAHAGKLILALGALGIVFGDLGTSPLYTEKTIFHAGTYSAARPPRSGCTGSPR